LADIKQIAEAMCEYTQRTGKRPTHIYVEPKQELIATVFQFGEKILGMEVILCDEMPLGKKEFFVCG
jgi:hypothetical protein